MFDGRGQQIILCAVSGVIVFLFVICWYLPLRRKMSAVKQAKAEQMVTIAKGMADASQITILEKQLRDMQMELESNELKIPDRRDFGTFLSRITELMDEYQLKEQSIEPGKSIKADKYNCIPVSMECKGQLNQIYHFYDRLQELDRLIRIERVKLSNDAAYDGWISMETDAIIYYQAGMEQG